MREREREREREIFSIKFFVIFNIFSITYKLFTSLLLVLMLSMKKQHFFPHIDKMHNFV